MALSYPYPLKDPGQVQREYVRVLDGLAEGHFVASHIWLVIVQKGINDRAWTFDNLPGFLALTDAGSEDVMLRKVWTEDTTRRPSNRQASGNVRMVLRGGTAVNLSNFILACCQDSHLLKTYNKAIVRSVLFPFGILIAHQRGMSIRTHKKLMAIHRTLQTTNSL